MPPPRFDQIGDFAQIDPPDATSAKEDWPPPVPAGQDAEAWQRQCKLAERFRGKILSTQELLEYKFEKHMKARERVRYNVDAHALEIFISADCGHWYQIGLERCQDYEQLLRWIVHLSSKIWFDIFTMRAFISTWETATGLSVRGCP